MEKLQSGTGEIQAGSLLKDPLLKRLYPGRFDRGILEKQLLDVRLLRRDLGEVANMDMEELASSVLTNVLAQDEPAAPEPAEEEKPAPGAGEPADGPGREPGEQRVTVQIEGMGVEAKLILGAPGPGERPPTEREMLDALARAGVVRGVRAEFVTRLAERPIYGRKFKIAQGALPVDGEDGRAVFHFDTSVDLTPQIGEDGLADYKSLDYARNVKEGDLLCEIVPPTAGSDGFSIFGETLPGRTGKPVEVACGSNTILSEDKREIYAGCDGQVYLKGNKVLVSRVLTVDRVDASTGNILFVGTVQVKGDVAGGFTIRAGGDIVVKGVCENATLVSGGNIVLCGGMKGQDTGLLDAGGSIRTIFIENARVRAKKNIYADVLLGSTIECGELVSLSGANGCLVGGRCTAGRCVKALRIGNTANIATLVCLRDMEALTSRQAENALAEARYRDAVERLTQIAEMAVSAVDDPRLVQMTLARVVILKYRLEAAAERLKGGEAGGGEGGARTVVIRECLFPNTSFEIDGAVFKNLTVKYGCTLRKARDKIALSSTAYY